ncbi:sensor histidine kinase [Nocardioides marmoriginsengisoli]|uniref:histidine kinase n=1 Tax=Nocardioides marmoriginsengisoli TaxID=661483 RepID=A0A3N0CNB4_9ACTN|nr:sensor histidine kinase [Nocardioides marmoriginsengisoli]RNL64791.1 sensor histidine kinase [Nocardioides marmoriginsengisoli]
MLRLRTSSLVARVVLTNGLLFALGTALLAFSPATVSSRPLVSEVVVLVVGLSTLILANALLVRRALQPLDRLVADVETVRSDAGAERVGEPVSGLGRTLAVAVNDLLARIESGNRERDLASLAGQEAESARIAQELHDGVGQSLTALLLELGRRDPPDDDLRERVRASLDEVRGVARQLRPHVLEDLGLRSALAALTTDLFGHGSTHVKRGIAPGLPELDEATELVVFRVAQEALTNVARHARADTVSISLSQRGDHLVLTVADDGVGIGPGANGTGIRGMRERAALVGGRLEVARRDGGTTVTLDVPVRRP